MDLIVNGQANGDAALISDTLSDAVQEMRNYLRDMPEVYAEARPELEKLIADMDAMRARLDAPPPPSAFK